MGDTETPTKSSDSPIDHNMLFSELFTTKMAKAMSKVLEPSAILIGIKLDGYNYAIWSQVVEMYISGKDKLGYINGELPPQSPTNLSFRKWRTDNNIVKGWLINSMDPALIGNFI
ncbi:hypothetical protein MRB53_006669 [Persea americana]|uniref:Uncharacterized protein n=1 Tax=Persea americana TaxID=3435 RepID=A0ACC2MGL7_PERAE|nr:hypothetical protein MRB53_006669 [Persea americana]